VRKMWRFVGLTDFTSAVATPLVFCTDASDLPEPELSIFEETLGLEADCPVHGSTRLSPHTLFRTTGRPCSRRYRMSCDRCIRAARRSAVESRKATVPH
jgi:hypothetical protein